MRWKQTGIRVKLLPDHTVSISIILEHLQRQAVRLRISSCTFLQQCFSKLQIGLLEIRSPFTRIGETQESQEQDITRYSNVQPSDCIWCSWSGFFAPEENAVLLATKGNVKKVLPHQVGFSKCKLHLWLSCSCLGKALYCTRSFS